VSPDTERVPVRGTWWRVVAAGLDPLELRDPPGDGRWQRGDVVGATYLADSEATVWAEWYRALAERALPPRVALPVDLWRVNVDIAGVADLSDPAALAAAGVAPPSPGRGGWPPYQAVGERLHSEGHVGVLAPSAARPDGLVLCVFRGERPPDGVHRRGRARRIEETPPPPRGLRT
jgi:RES domain-containing protein